MKPKLPSGKIRPRLLLVLLVLAGISIGIGVYRHLTAPGDAAQNGGSSGNGGAMRGGPNGSGGPGGPGGFARGPQPVAASTVKVQDTPIWIDAIGTMIPKNLVTVHTRIDGELLKLHFTEGQMVKAGQLLAELDPRAAQAQLLQANGQLTRDGALLKNAQLDLERYRKLLDQDSISKQQVDTQEALVRQYQGTVEVDRGAVAAAQLQLDYTRIKAPVSGRIGLRQVDPGNIVHSGDTNGIVVIAQVQPITAVFAVPEINLPTIAQALAAKTPTAVEVWDRDLKQKLASGTLLTADNQIDTTTGTLKLKAEFANADGKLFPNQFVNVRLAAGVIEHAKLVPGSAVLRGAKGNYVYVIKDSKVSAVPVTVGPAAGDQIVIEGPVRPGSQVVTDGADKLRDGAQVNVISAEAREKATAEVPKKRGKRGQGAQGGGGGSPAGGGDKAAEQPPQADHADRAGKTDKADNTEAAQKPARQAPAKD